jgi:succinate-acetate transporter protein
MGEIMAMTDSSVKPAHPDPSALGLFGLAMVTLVASSQKLGLTSDTSLVVPWAVFLGAMAQLLAGKLDYNKGNVFGATAFCGYGFFWLAVAFSWLIQHGLFGQAMMDAADPKQLGVGFLGYLIFTVYMTVAATETNKVLLIIFVLIDFLFLGLCLSAFGVAHQFFHNVAAVSELLIAVFSFYGSAANVFKNHFGRDVLPIGKPLGIFKK